MIHPWAGLIYWASFLLVAIIIVVALWRQGK